jgi:uncharacterized protein (PEP-CTERM system associated)
LTETYTTNIAATSARPESDWVTEVRPGVSMVSRDGALQGTLNYALAGVAYARHADLNNVHHTLSSNGELKLLDGRVGMLAAASAARQVMSAFGTQTSDPSLYNLANTAQTFAYSLAPYVTGETVGDVRYLGKVTYAETRTGATHFTNTGNLGDTKSGSAEISLSRDVGAVKLGMDASRTVVESGNLARGHLGSAIFSARYQPDIEWQFTARAGVEVNDIYTGASERYSTWGLGAVWRPSPRTEAHLDFDHRFFGQSHAVNLMHRTARTVWIYTDSRQLQTGGMVGRALASAYDLYFALFASAFPDPVERDQVVRQFLASQGMSDQSQVVVGGFASGGSLVFRAQRFSVAYQGVRQTLVFALIRGKSSSLGPANPIMGGVYGIDQQGFTGNWSLRVTSADSLALTAGSQRTAGSGALPGNDLRTVTLGWSTRLGPRTSGSLSLRHASFDSEVNPYHESAIIGAVRVQF